MNREIKFRLWTGITMEYNIVSGALGTFYALIDKNDAACLAPTSKYQPETPLMQYTGVKDRDGKEIYEGDIIRGMHDFGPAGFHSVTCSVRWNNEVGYQWNYWDLSTIEVIGNIFDNPELIN